MIRSLFRRIFSILLWPFRFVHASWLKFRGFFMDQPEDSTLGDSLQNAVENPASLLEHLNELRKRLFRAILVLLLGATLAFTFVTPILNWLAQPVGGIDKLQAVEVTEPVGVVMRVSLLVGFALALPYITFELLLFVAPALNPRARLYSLLGIPLVFVFFIGGMAFAYYLLLPAALPVMLHFMGIPTLPRPNSYIQFVTALMFWLGFFFEMPLLSYVLASMGILKGQMLKSNWRIAVLIISIVAAVVTPTVDPVNMMLVMLPLLGLYMLSMILAFLARPRQLQAAPA